MKTSSLYRVFGKAHANLASRQINRSCFRRQRGASAIEYAIIASVIALGIFVVGGGANGAIATAFSEFFTRVSNSIGAQG